MNASLHAVDAMSVGITHLEDEGFSAADLRAARRHVTELIAADVEYDAALEEKTRVLAAWKLAHCVATATDADFLPLHAADGRVQATLARRRAALAAVQGGAA